MLNNRRRLLKKKIKSILIPSLVSQNTSAIYYTYYYKPFFRVKNTNHDSKNFPTSTLLTLLRAHDEHINNNIMTIVFNTSLLLDLQQLVLSTVHFKFLFTTNTYTVPTYRSRGNGLWKGDTLYCRIHVPTQRIRR